MKNLNEIDHLHVGRLENKRRDFLKKGIFYGTLTGITGLSLAGCKDKDTEKNSPVKELMLGHGVLNRVMLIYDACKIKLVNGEQFPMDVLRNSALITRDFIEDYHEKMEEEFLFPQFAKANLLVGLVQVLYIQHHAGRQITDNIIEITGRKDVSDIGGIQNLTALLNNFNSMYRAHEAREDTVLFPALRQIISQKEYHTMAEDFEKREFGKFGAGGYQSTIDKVALLEAQLGINELEKYTPV